MSSNIWLVIHEFTNCMQIYEHANYQNFEDSFVIVLTFSNILYNFRLCLHVYTMFIKVTSQDADDGKLAGCTDGTDCCCNARIAYAHAFNQGGATVLPKGYCTKQSDCTQIYSGCGGKTGPMVSNFSSQKFMTRHTKK